MVVRIAIAVLLTASIGGCGEAHPGEGKLASLASAAFPAAAPMTVTCPGIGRDGVIPDRYSARGGNVSPPIAWTSAPGAKSYAVIVQDPDAQGAAPFVHWLIWNIPANISAIPQGVRAGERPADPSGAVQGRNGADSVGYHGPAPPPGGAHRYFFQVFALDGPLPAPPGVEVVALVGSMKGHVIAKGQCVGTFQSHWL
jgi:Raf kinase inhibitor-like YbhB/YbcL family protein